jgi:hypothetical protein
MAINSNFRTLTADNIEGVVAPRNYLKNSFENGTTAGWTEMAVTLTSGLPTGTPTISSTAAASIALTNTTITPLSLSRSLLVTGAAGWTAGQGFISDEFTIDRMDAGKPLTVSFDYELKSGTLNFSGTLGSQTLMVYIYDATAGGANWIQPAGYLGMNQSSGPGRVTATFQTSVVAGQKYRVAVIASQAVGSACSLEFDNFTCSRVTAPIGPVVTDWVSYTPTVSVTSGSLTNATVTGRYRRNGDSIQVYGAITFSGASAAFSELFPSLPSGLSFDTAKLASTSSLAQVLGTVFAYDAASTLFAPGNVVYRTATQVDIRMVATQPGINPVNVSTGVFTNISPITFNVGDTISWQFTAPIQGWSSSVQMSNDTDTRVVDFRAYTTSARTMNNTAPTIIFENVDKDSHGAYNAATGVYTVPVSGDYVVSGQMRVGAITMTAGAFFGFSAKVGGTYSVRNHYTAFRAVTASSAGNYAEGSGSVLLTNLQAGQTISVGGWADNATATFTDGANTFCIQRISGPSVVAATETVSMTATTSTTSILSGTPTKAIFSSVTFDSHSAYNASTGTYTVPVSGKYLVSGFLYWNNASSTNSFRALIYKNSAKVIDGSWGIKAGTEAASISTVTMNCVAGDRIEIFGLQSDGAARALAGAEQVFCVNRIGN